MKTRLLLLAALLPACASAPPCPETPKPAKGHHGKHHEGHHGKHHKGHHGKHRRGHHAHGEGDKGHKQLVHGFSEGPEMWKKRLEDPTRAASQKPAEVVAALKLEDGMTVADIGAGTGYFLAHLSRAAGPKGRVLAVDIEPKFVRFLKQRAAEEKLGNVHARLALGDDPLLADGSVDRMLIVNTWHHIPKREAYSKKLLTALKPKGALWIVDFNQTTTAGPPKNHRLLPSVVVKELEGAGFKVTLDEKMLADQYIVIGEKP